MYATVSFRLGSVIDAATNARIHSAAATLVASEIAGIRDVVPSYTVLTIEFDPRRTCFEAVTALTLRALESDAVRAADTVITVPTRYDGPDLDEVAHRTGLHPNTVAHIHASTEYRVHALGFTPGFAFMASVDPRIRVPRRTTPRHAVPPSAVAIANEQTGVYPLPSPGGWHVIGRSLIAPYDPWREEPFLFTPGARVRFVPADGTAPPVPRTRPLLPAEPTRPAFEVQRVGLRDLIVDAGRFGVARFGLARSGPIDPVAMADANTHVGNASMATALEMAMRGPMLRALRETIVGFAGKGLVPNLNGRRVRTDRPLNVGAGDMLSFEIGPEGVVTYLALPGGIESATQHGSASVDVRGRLGRPLEVGDLLGQSGAWVRRSHLRVQPRNGVPARPCVVRVVPGPHASADALDRLDGATFTVTAADRMGVCMEGPTIPSFEIVSEPTELGAMQITTAGAPIVLLNDRGTLGGYAKPAIVVPRDIPCLAQARVGASILVRVVEDVMGLYRRVDLSG